MKASLWQQPASTSCYTFCQETKARGDFFKYFFWIKPWIYLGGLFTIDQDLGSVITHCTFTPWWIVSWKEEIWQHLVGWMDGWMDGSWFICICKNLSLCIRSTEALSHPHKYRKHFWANTHQPAGSLDISSPKHPHLIHIKDTFCVTWQHPHLIQISPKW